VIALLSRRREDGVSGFLSFLGEKAMAFPAGEGYAMMKSRFLVILSVLF